jgi:quinol monooxygenase YgiN
MKYGTLAKYKVKPGHADQLMAGMTRIETNPPAGFLYSTVFRSTTDPNEIWMSVVFESEEAYKKSADSPEMDKEYRSTMEHLESAPEWHDAHVIHEAMAKAGKA